MKLDFREASLTIIGSDSDDVVKMIESAEQAQRARHRLTIALTESGANGRSLARRISACNLARPCRSAACPVCLRHFRIWWGSEIAAYMESGFADWFTVNVVPSDEALPIGELHRFRWDHLKDRFRKQIARSQIHRAIIVGAFDYALQQFKDGRSPKWRPHIYFLTQTGGKARIEGALRKHYLRDEDTRKPVQVTEQRTTQKDRLATATYTFKSYFYERKPAADERGNADTDKRGLKPPQLAELALLLDRQGFLGRMIRYGNDPSLPLLTTR